jgi:signal transduction histidine kinase
VATRIGLRGFGDRLRTANPWLVDSLVGVTFAVLGLLSTAGRGDVPSSGYEPRDALSVALVLAATLVFVFLRHYPFTVLCVSTVATVLNNGLGHNEGFTPFFVWVAVVTVAALCDTRTTLAAAAVVFGALAGLLAFSKAGFTAGDFARNVALFFGVFMVGITIRARRLRIEALEERATAVEREREEESRRAVADERLRIARELHDIVAHSMGVIAVQAGVGEHVIDTDPAEAKAALRAISDTSRSTLTEIRRMLGVLREGDDETTGPATYTPAPGLADLDRLVAEIETAGVTVAVSFAGSPVELPKGVDLAAYRIIQEALTNVLKHAGAARAEVVVRHEPGVLALEVRDDGRGVNGRSKGGGHGIVGMRERVALYGGTLEACPVSGGGFHVVARLPYQEER